MRMKKRTKRIAIGFVLSLAAIAVVCGILFGLVQTQAGKRQLVRFVSSSLEKEGGVRVELGELRGLVPFDFRLDHLNLSDRDGRWMVAEGIVMRWSPLPLLRGRLRIREVSAERLGIDRAPRTESTKGEPSKGLPKWPGALDRLQLNRFAIQRLELGESLLGEKAQYQAEGRLSASGPQAENETSVRLMRIDRDGENILLNAALRRGILTLGLELDQTNGGLLAEIMGFKEGFSLKLQGEGPLKDWKGTLRFASEELGRCEAVLGLAYGETPGLTAGGTLHLPKAFIPEALMPKLGFDATFDFALRRPGKNTLALDHLTLKARELNMEWTGSLDLEKESTEGRFSLNGVDLKTLGTQAGINLEGKGKMEGRFSGYILRPEIALEIVLEGMKADTFRAGSMITRLEFEWLGEPGLGFQGLGMKGNGEIRDMGLEHHDPLPETVISWEAAAEGPVNGEILVRHFKAAGRHLSAEFSGRLETAGPRGMLEGILELSDLRAFKGLMGFDLPGSTRLKTRIEGDGQTRSLSAQVLGKLALLKTKDSPFVPILGGDLEYAGNLRLTERENLKIEAFSFHAPAGKLTGNASLDLPGQAVKGTWRLVLPRLNHFATVLKHPMEGAMEWNGSVNGALNEMALHAEAKSGEVVFEGWSFRDLAVNLRAGGLPSRPEGILSFSLSHRGHRVRGETDYRLEPGSLDLATLSLKGAGSELTGSLNMDLEKILFKGEIKGSCRDFSVLESIIGERLEGGGRFRALLKPEAGVQAASFVLEAEKIRGRFGQAGNMGVQGEIKDIFNHPRGKAECDIKAFRIKDLSLDTITVKAEGDPTQVSFRGKARGHYREPLDLELSGGYAVNQEGFTLALIGLGMDYGGQSLQLVRPATWHFSNKGIDFRGFELRLASGTLKADGKMDPAELDVDLRFEALPLETFKLAGIPETAGTATGRFRLAGRPERPEGNLEFQLEGIRVRTSALDEIPPLTVKGRVGLKPDELHAELFLQGLTAKPFEARVDIPVSVSVRPFSWSLPPKGRLKGEFLGQIDPARIVLLAGLDDQTLEGQMDVRFTLDGTVENPELKGGVRLEKGGYENVRSGTLLKDIEVEIAAGTPRLLLKRALAGDGEKGKISAKGWLDVISDQGFPFKVDVSMDQATLLRRDDATVTAGGQLTLSGSIEEAMVGGQINLETAEFRIPEQLPPGITEIEVIEIHGDAGKAREEPVVESKKEAKIKIDVSVKSPGRVFVRGRGLDSEWEGQLKVSGEARAPGITGHFSMVRGHFNFLGKRFDLKSGLISFDGSSPPFPRIDVLAEASTEELTARLQLSGSMASPEMALTSEPVLPSDEILARLLFGQSVSDMSPFQALQLAQAASVLAGGRGVDFMGKTRQFLGVDLLDVKQGGEDSGETSIRAGKYLSEKVYLEVEQGMGSETGKASVEWEVTPNITLETEAGANAEGGVGVKWKWDY